MARILQATGACPVCDEPVPRTVHTHEGVQREIYRCPTHGRLEYGQADIPLASLAGVPASIRGTLAAGPAPAP